MMQTITEVRAQCRTEIERCVERWQWGLIRDHETFLEGVVAYVTASMQDDPAAPTQAIIESGVQRCYSALWYQACCSQGSWQEAGWNELTHYLSRFLMGRCQDPTLVLDASQLALMKVWEARDQLQEPTKFQGWARRIALNALYDLLRPARRAPATVALAEEQDTDAPPEAPAPPATMTPLDLLSPRLVESERAQIIQAIKTCLRSPERILVIVGTFLEGLTMQDLVAALGQSPPQIHQLRYRALKKLQTCETLLALLKH